MAGYDLAEARFENRTLSDDAMWSAFSNLFSAHSKNSSSYKFGFLKAIMDKRCSDVLFAICEGRGYTVEELMQVRESKRVKRGGFKDRIYWVGNEE